MDEAEKVYNLESDVVTTDWDHTMWNASAPASDHEAYSVTIAAIRDLAREYNIETDVEQCSITPLHYLFARYLANDAVIETLIDKLVNINPSMTRVRALVRL